MKPDGSFPPPYERYESVEFSCRNFEGSLVFNELHHMSE